jgi:hypothetical protein
MKRRVVASTALLLLLGLTIGGCAHVLLLDGLTGAVLPVFYGDDTIYARGYSDTKFRRITTGMTPAEVVALLGRPLREVREYEHRAGRLAVEIDEDGRVRSGAPPESDLGPPSAAVWSFTKTPNDSSYRVRVVRFRNGLVERIIHEYYVD